MRTLFYTNGKFDRSAIMKEAWKMAKCDFLEMSFSAALKDVWSTAKKQQKKAIYEKELEEKEAKMSSKELAESMGLIF